MAGTTWSSSNLVSLFALLCFIRIAKIFQWATSIFHASYVCECRPSITSISNFVFSRYCFFYCLSFPITTCVILVRLRNCTQIRESSFPFSWLPWIFLNPSSHVFSLSPYPTEQSTIPHNGLTSGTIPVRQLDVNMIEKSPMFHFVVVLC